MATIDIGVRSPYFVTHELTNATYGVLALTIDGTLRYSITKDVIPGTERVTIDISQLVRDYINPLYADPGGFNDSGEVSYSYVLTLYDSSNSALSPTKTDSGTATDGYQFYYNGNNYALPDSAELVTGQILYYAANESGFFYENVSNTLTKRTFTSSATSSGTVTIVRLPCTRYTGYPVTFLNRFGVLQQMWFTAKTVESQSVTGSQYKSKYNTDTGAIFGGKHQYQVYNKNARRRYTLNSDYITSSPDSYNDQIQELLLSEYLWIGDDDLNTSVPVNLVTSDVTYKTGLNDRLINYQLVFEQAFDLISTGR